MNTAIVGYPSSVNLGDWVQSLVIEFVWKKEFVAINREQLHKYRGPKVRLICNGWFMENPENWPPADKIEPLFISFHINPTVEKEFTQKESIDYFKKHEPIGCRDNYTLDLLRNHGVKAYFSGCLTLCYQKSHLFPNSSPKPSGILVTSVFDRLKPIILCSRGPVVMLRQLLKYPVKYIAYKIACRRLRRILSKTDRPITYASQIIDRYTLENQDSKQIALDYIRQVASAELVITSRIHTALPATAMGIPVLFLSDGLNHINHQSRLRGLVDYFEACSSKNLQNIDLETINAKSNHIEQAVKLKARIDRFMETG